MAPTTPARPEPSPLPGRIAAVLNVLAGLIAHARHFAATAATRAAAPEFAPAAAIFGTHEPPPILLRVQRGLLRAIALRDYLLARAARGRDLRFAWPPREGPSREGPPREGPQPNHRPPVQAPAPHARPARAHRPDPALLDPDHPAAFRLPTPEELAKEVRRRPVGRTITYICLDLGIAPGLCLGDFWNEVERSLRRYGGSLDRLYQVRERRRETFQRERDRRPETWHIAWWGPDHAAVRKALGCLIGESPPDGHDPLVFVPG